MPESRPPPSSALQGRALRESLAEAKLDWQLDLDSERRLIRELQQILRQHGPGPAFRPGARLGQAWQRRLAQRFCAWPATLAADRAWEGLDQAKSPQLADLKEIFFIGFRVPEPDFLRGLFALLRNFPEILLHLYLPPRDPLVGEEGRWLEWREALEAAAGEWEEWQASPPLQSLKSFPTVVHEASRLLATGFPSGFQLLLPPAGELSSHLEARYLSGLGLMLPSPSGSHASLSAELLAALGDMLPEGELSLRDFLAAKTPLFPDFQARLSSAGDFEGLRLLEGFLEKAKERLAAQSLFPESRRASDWLEELREDWLGLRLASTPGAKHIPWRRLDRPGIESPRRLWIAGLVDGAFPSAPAPAFFEDEQPFALGALEERLGFEQVLCSAGEELIFSHAEFSLEGRPHSASPWLDEFIDVETRSVELDLPMNPPRRSAYWEENLRREVQRQHPPLGLDDGNLDELGLKPLFLAQMRERPLSPTYIDDLAKCPWSFFARRHLRLSKEPEEDLEIDPRRRGGLQHRLLESVFAELIQKYFDRGSCPSLAEAEASLERAFAVLSRETLEEASPIPPALLLDQLERMREITRFLLTEEHQSWIESKRRLIPRHLEWSFGSRRVPPLQVKIEAGLDLPLKGQVDRIDQSEDGRHFLLIDYKSSRAGEMASDLREGLSLQLWIYLRAVCQNLFAKSEPLGALYWDLKDRERKHGMARRELYKEFTHRHRFGPSKSIMKEEEYEAVSSRLEERLRALLRRALAGDYSLDPEKCLGNYCNYFEICRYGNKPKN